MHTITTAIRQHCLEHQQTHLKEDLLKFFLNCECKLRRQGNAEWSRVINCQLRRMVGLHNLVSLLTHRITATAFALIQRESYLDDRTRVAEQLFNEFGDLNDMEISEEVKIKTKYFFQWTQYLNEKKAIRAMRNKEVEDIKKAKVFHHYSVKFHAFLEWKQYIRRLSLVKERAAILKLKTQKRQLQATFNQIKEKIEIISIENLLETAVREKIQTLQISTFFRKLEAASQAAKSKVSYLHMPNNLWLFRLYTYLARKGYPLKNKSSIASRAATDQHYNRSCLLACWKGLKEMTHKTALKVKDIKSHIRNCGFRQFRLIRCQRKSLHQSRLKMSEMLKNNSLKFLFKSIIKKREEQNIFFQIKGKLRQLINQRSFLYAISRLSNLRRQRKAQEQASLMLQKQQDYCTRKRFLLSLKTMVKEKTSFSASIVKIRNQYLISFLASRMKEFRLKKKEISQTKKELAKIHQMVLLRHSWRGFKAAKKIKTNQLQIIKSVVLTLQLKLKRTVFDKMEDHLFSYGKTQQLVHRCQHIVLKMTFVTILNRMLSKKMKLKTFATKQDNRLKRKLFDLLSSHRTLMQEMGSEITVIFKRVMKRQLLRNLAAEIDLRHAQDIGEKKLEILRQRQFFANMSQNNSIKKIYQIQEQQTCKMFLSWKLSRFVESTSALINYRREQQRKNSKIIKNMIKNSIKGLRKAVRSIRNKAQDEKQKEVSMQSFTSTFHAYLAVKNLKQLVRKSDAIISQKCFKIHNERVRSAIKEWRFSNKKMILKKSIKKSMFHEFVHLSSQMFEIKQKDKILRQQYKRSCLKYTLDRICSNLRIDEEEEEQRVQEIKLCLKTKRQRLAKQTLIKRIVSHYELKQNNLLLLNYRARQGCRQLIKLYLKQKSRNIKELIALRHYASNIKRQAMRGLKKAVNLTLLKENRTRTENNSKMRVQKSIDAARKKSKLIQTIERYNLSRVSRVIR